MSPLIVLILKDLFVILQNKPNKNMLDYYSRKFNSKIDNKIKSPFVYSSNSSKKYLTLADIKIWFMNQVQSD